MLNSTRKIIRDIIDIKVQGASNIVFSAQDCLEFELKAFTAKNFKTYFEELILELWKTRPTEPALKNLLTSFKIELDKTNGSKQDIKKLIEFVQTERQNLKDAIIKIAEDFAKSTKQQTIIFTHCHSSIVERCIIELHKKGLVKYVVNTETRPLFQGRITSEKLANAGVSVRHIVDSSVYAKAKNIIENDKFTNILFLTGADVITNKGDLINKIGTSQINLALKSLGIKHYVMTISAKIDTVDRNWNLDKIELRNPDEVWQNKNQNIKIINYAFDITPANNIAKIYTEKGNGKVPYIVVNQKSDANYKKVWEQLGKLAEQN